MQLLLLILFSLLTACHAVHVETATMEQSYPETRAARLNSELMLKYLHTGQTDLAVDRLNLALQQNPNDPIVLMNAAYYFEKSGDFYTANQYYMRAISLSANSGDALLNYGTFLCRNGYYEQSLLYFKKVACIPGYSRAREARANEKFCLKELQAPIGDKAQ